MPIEFKIEGTFPIAFVAETVPGTGKAEVRTIPVLYAQVLSDPSPEFLVTIDHIANAFFKHIPELPNELALDHIVLLVRSDGRATAFVNEIVFETGVTLKTSREVEEPTEILLDEIASIESVSTGVTVPDDCGVIVFRRIGWKRSVLFDFSRLHADEAAKPLNLERALAVQAMHLSGLLDPREGINPSDEIDLWLSELRTLLDDADSAEGQFQRHLNDAPWLFAPDHLGIRRHPTLDDKNVPDFLLERSSDGLVDLVEIKRPQLDLFKQNGQFGAHFHEAWGQAERYLEFADNNRDYLLREKGIQSYHPNCYLVVGHDLTTAQIEQIRVKQKNTPRIRVMTYNDVIARARQLAKIRSSSVLIDFAG